MPNKIIVEIEAHDYWINERDVAEALKSHFPNMQTTDREISPTPNGDVCRICGAKLPAYSRQCVVCGTRV